jgi:hypothetical protein
MYTLSSRVFANDNYEPADICETMARLARHSGIPVVTEIYGIDVTAYPNDTAEAVLQRFTGACVSTAANRYFRKKHKSTAGIK